MVDESAILNDAAGGGHLLLERLDRDPAARFSTLGVRAPTPRSARSE